MASAGEEAARVSEPARASADPAARSRRAVALDLAGAIALLVLVQQIALRAVGLQWDFRVYLAAARAARAGLDPYVVENLAHVSGHPVALPFLYPPIALLPFLALAWPSFLTAGVLWMGLKVGIAFGLAAWWGRSFAPRAGGVIAAGALAVFGANAALVTDLRSGNVGLVEAGLLWWGFACWLRGRDGRFAALVVAAALFKL